MQWGINTRVTDILRGEKLLPMFRRAGLVTEAQFIVGLENETAETLEDPHQMARDWHPDMANWAMHTPWPFSDLFQELREKVEVFDFEKYNFKKYNFATPMMRPDAMARAERLDRVKNNYRRLCEQAARCPGRSRGRRELGDDARPEDRDAAQEGRGHRGGCAGLRGWRTALR